MASLLFHLGRLSDAILREKRIKKCNRAWKIRLIESMNPEWNDLFDELWSEINDGPADLGGTLAMAEQHVKAGVEIVAATPHVAWDMPNEAATIALRLADVHCYRLEQAEDVPEVAAAAIDLAFSGDLAVALVLSQRLIGRKVWVK